MVNTGLALQRLSTISNIAVCNAVMVIKIASANSHEDTCDQSRSASALEKNRLFAVKEKNRLAKMASCSVLKVTRRSNGDVDQSLSENDVLLRLEDRDSDFKLRSAC